MKISVPAFRPLPALSLFFSFIFLNLPKIQAQPDGEALFKAQCAACHTTTASKLVGPGLKDVHTRAGEEWLISWTKNSQAMVQAGDAYAVKIFEENNKIAMPPFALSDEEIKAIFAYIKAQGEPAATTAAAPGAVAPADAAPTSTTPWTLWILIGVLLVLFLALGKIRAALEKAIRAKQGMGEPPILSPQQACKNWVRGNKKLIAAVVIVFLAWGSVKGWYALAAIGIYTDYAPEQPIRFSHKLHAGQNGISCNYCHSSAEKSRHAGIPSANVCMNCHKFVQQGPVYGTTEIAKIYKALDYDPNTGKYGANPQPIQWIQVHNLPDLAYFNHSQHTTVGGLECQTCHGPVQEMETVKQFSPLTMGWCIQCHRDTEVKMAGNGYYTELHEKLKAKYGADAKLTVDKIGGLECARCHY